MEKISGLDFKIKEMAQRICELREITRYTAQEMAEKTGVSVEEYLSCENGESDLNFAFIYRCALAFVDVDGTSLVTEGRCDGTVRMVAKGENGFGYDPVFYVPQEDCTFAQLPAERKNRISHRARALEAFAEQIRREQDYADK